MNLVVAPPRVPDLPLTGRQRDLGTNMPPASGGRRRCEEDLRGNRGRATKGSIDGRPWLLGDPRTHD